MKPFTCLLLGVAVAGLCACSDKRQDIADNTSGIPASQLETRAQVLENSAEAAVNAAIVRLEELNATTGSADGTAVTRASPPRRTAAER